MGKGVTGVLNSFWTDEYFWGPTRFRHCLRLDTKEPIEIRVLPPAMQERLYANKLVADTDIAKQHNEWLEENISSPYFLGKNYIMFSDQSDRTLFTLQFS